MGVYEAIKDAVFIGQKLDNVLLVKSLLDAQVHVSCMQYELSRLRRQNEELREQLKVRGAGVW